MEFIKKIFHKLKDAGFLHYAIVGSSSYVINLGTLIMMVQVFKMDPVVGASINQIFVLFYIFLLNKFWSFKAKGKSLHQMIRFFILVGWNYTFSIVWMWFWIKKVGVTYFIGRWDVAYIFVNLFSIFIMITWNFLLYKYWVYKKDPEAVVDLIN